VVPNRARSAPAFYSEIIQAREENLLWMMEMTPGEDKLPWIADGLSRAERRERRRRKAGEPRHAFEDADILKIVGMDCYPLGVAQNASRA
jgi:hypothetical protein